MWHRSLTTGKRTRGKRSSLLGRREETGMMRVLRGIVFDMDGTLTVPVIDFPGLYKAVLGDNHRPSSGRPVDILHEIEQWSPADQQRAFEIIAEFERQGQEKLQIMPGARELCEFIDAKNLMRGLITRNVKESVDYFHARFELFETGTHTLSGGLKTALGREFRPYKPHAAPLLHICSTWGVSPGEVLMVGDSARDDIVCGHRAGAITCLLDERGKYDLHSLPLEQRPAYRVKSLYEVAILLQREFDLTPTGF